MNRLPASFFVSVAYDCWAFRRLGVLLDGQSGAITRWLYRDPSHPVIPMLDQAGFTRTGREVVLQSPLTEDAVRGLKVGDMIHALRVSTTGVMIGPGVYDCLAILGREETLRRTDLALALKA